METEALAQPELMGYARPRIGPMTS